MEEISDTNEIQWSKWPLNKTIATDDTGKTDEDNAVTINVLSNDKNVKGIYSIFPVKQVNDVSLTGSALTDSVAAEDYTTSLSTKPYTITLDSGAEVTLQNNKVTYNPNGKFEDLNDGQTAFDSFGYAAYGRYGTDTAKVSVTITGVTDVKPPITENQAPVAKDDFASVYNYPYPKPYPYPEPYPLPLAEADASGETSTAQADLSHDLIFTTLALGEEGDPYLSPVDIDVLWNDKDPDGYEMTIGTVGGVDVAPGQANIPVGKFGATVTISPDGKMLTYDPGSFDWYSLDPLAVEEDDAAVTASGDIDTALLWEGYPLSDTFKYQAKDEYGALSNEATVTVDRYYLYYYDVPMDSMIAETSTDVGDSSLLVV